MESEDSNEAAFKKARYDGAFAYSNPDVSGAPPPKPSLGLLFLDILQTYQSCYRLYSQPRIITPSSAWMISRQHRRSACETLSEVTCMRVKNIYRISIALPEHRSLRWSVGACPTKAQPVDLPAMRTFSSNMIRFWPIVLAIWISTISMPFFAHASVTFYVSPTGDDGNPGTEAAPFRSIERAQTAVRPLTDTMTSDITVVLRGGLYQLADTVRFDHRDSGMNGFQVVYRSFLGEHAALSGGRRITGWAMAQDGLFRANVGANRFRQLYVNGGRATRARTPNAPEFSRLLRWDEGTQRIVIAPNSIASWSNLPSVEMVIMKQWTQNNLRVESFLERDEGHFIQPREPDRTKAFLGHLFLRLEAQSYFFENALEFLDSPGEWYLHVPTEEVFYLPRGTEDLSQSTVIAPHLEQLLDVRGTAGKPVHHLAFIGLTFEYAGWMEPTEEGFAVSQADAIYHGTNPSSGRVAAAVNFTHAHHLRFERNILQHLGGTGLVLHTDITDVQVIGNRLRDLSGSGIVIDSLLEARPLDPRLVCQDILVANNLITGIGLDYRSSVGIFAGFVSNTYIAHNDIHDAPYTGISVGWGWTDKDTLLGPNRIIGNRVFRVMTTMADGAGIYTLSKQSGTIIQDNYIYDLLRSPWAGNAPISAIYLDEGSTGITVENNALERVPLGIFLHRASENTIVNTAGTYEERWGARNNSFHLEPGHSLDGVKLQAGLEPSYRNLHSLE